VLKRLQWRWRTELVAEVKCLTEDVCLQPGFKHSYGQFPLGELVDNQQVGELVPLMKTGVLDYCIVIGMLRKFVLAYVHSAATRRRYLAGGTVPDTRVAIVTVVVENPVDELLVHRLRQSV